MSVVEIIDAYLHIHPFNIHRFSTYSFPGAEDLKGSKTSVHLPGFRVY